MIIRHIESALYELEEVIIPEFGAFVKEEVLAQVASENLKPLHTTVRFDYSAAAKTSNLASRIAKSEAITIAEAEREIAYWVAEAKHNLSEVGEFMIGDIGNLRGNELKSAVLEPNEESNFAADAYGLPTIKTTIVADHQDQVVETLSSQQSTNAVAEPVVAKKKTGSFIIWFLVICIIATTVAIFYLIKQKSAKDQVAVHTEEEGGVVFGRKAKPSKSEEEVVLAPEPKKQESPAPETAKPATPEKSEPAKAASPPEKEPVVAKPNSPAKPAKAAEPDKIYHVIVGSFGNPDNAYKLSKELQAKGFEVVVIDPQKGSKLYKVSIGQFDSEQEAAGFIKQKQGGFKEILFLMKP